MDTDNGETQPKEERSVAAMSATITEFGYETIANKSLDAGLAVNKQLRR